MRKPNYGELKSKENPEAYAIWFSRDIEPDDCEPFGLRSDFVTDDIRISEIQRGSDMWALAKTALTKKQECVLRMRLEFGFTLLEVGNHFGVCGSRAMQIERQALRKLKAYAMKIGGYEE
jgi:DNA-directed RNA polymerase sigma subunit (sigma70/sigma32)